MKKIAKYFMTANVAMGVAMSGAMAASNDGLCKLIEGLAPVIKTLRTLAFIGAAFVLMDWAWGWIQKGEVKKDDIKDKGIGMFVGFFLLLGVGMVLSFIASTSGMNSLGCITEVLKVTK